MDTVRPSAPRGEPRSRGTARYRGSGSRPVRRLIGCASGSKRSAQQTTGRLFALFWPLRIAQSHTRATAVLVDEFDAGYF